MMSEYPLTSIIIPVHNCLQLTRECLQSLRKNTSAPYEIILIDDASQPDTAEFLSQQVTENVQLIRNEERKNYAANNNAGASLAKGKYLCLLNNDTFVTPGWLTHMVDACETESDIGVLGNKHLFPETRLLHHCGMAFDEHDYPWHIYPNTDPEAPEANRKRDFQCVTFACVLIRRELYTQLNGLDESYKNGFEDCDFCLRAREHGSRVSYTPESVIFHYGQSTPGRTDNDDANWQFFNTRWGGKVEQDMAVIINRDHHPGIQTERHPGFLQRTLRFFDL